MLAPGIISKKAMKKGIIIVGGGPAGLVAAIASARNGADTLLIEGTGCLGGMATSGLLSFWGAFDDRDRGLDWELDKRIAKGLPISEEPSSGKRIIKGIPEEILNKLIELKGALDFGTGCIPINPETLKYVAEKMLMESGVKILYYSQVVGVVKEKNRIKAVITANKSGLQKIYGDIFIDATGDGDLAAFAGAPFQKGRTEDGRMQGVTLVFRLGGVKFSGRDYTDREDKKRCNAIFKKAFEDGKVSGLYGVGCINSIPDMEGVVAMNTQHTHNIDGTKPDDLTKAAINGRKEVREISALFKRYLKGFENSFLIDTAFLVGVRETRRIIGEYVLTKEDVLGAKKFKDAICKGAWLIDCHLPSLKKETKADICLKPGTHYDIPYRCLTPKRVNNLLVAGRCISATHKALAALRIMPFCMAMGQAAGTAAVFSLEKKISPRNLDVSLLQKRLLEQGAVV